jgi:hypothetical protein
MGKMTDNLEMALRYLNQGLSIIPLYSPPMIKRIAPKKWVEDLQKALALNKALANPLPEKDIIIPLIFQDVTNPWPIG